MPSFDAVSKVDQHGLSNAIDEVNHGVGACYNFKGSDSKIEHSGNELNLVFRSENQTNSFYFERKYGREDEWRMNRKAKRGEKLSQQQEQLNPSNGAHLWNRSGAYGSIRIAVTGIEKGAEQLVTLFARSNFSMHWRELQNIIVVDSAMKKTFFINFWLS